MRERADGKETSSADPPCSHANNHRRALPGCSSVSKLRFVGSLILLARFPAFLVSTVLCSGSTGAPCKPAPSFSEARRPRKNADLVPASSSCSGERVRPLWLSFVGWEMGRSPPSLRALLLRIQCRDFQLRRWSSSSRLQTIPLPGRSACERKDKPLGLDTCMHSRGSNFVSGPTLRKSSENELVLTSFRRGRRAVAASLGLVGYETENREAVKLDYYVNLLRCEKLSRGGQSVTALAPPHVCSLS